MWTYNSFWNVYIYFLLIINEFISLITKQLKWCSFARATVIHVVIAYLTLHFNKQCWINLITSTWVQTFVQTLFRWHMHASSSQLLHLWFLPYGMHWMCMYVCFVNEASGLNTSDGRLTQGRNSCLPWESFCCQLPCKQFSLFSSHPYNCITYSTFTV